MRKLNIRKMKSIKITSIKKEAFLKRSGRRSIVEEKKYSNLEISRYRRTEKELDALLKCITK